MRGNRAYKASRKRTRFVFFLVLVVGIGLWYGRSLLPGSQEPEPDYLQLVNWTHPIQSSARRLVNLADLLDGVAYAQRSDMLVNERAGEAARDMFQAAAKEGLSDYLVMSAYRSVERQAQLWANKRASDPNYGADPFTQPVSVMPSTASEHATGLALDIVCLSYPELEAGFADTDAGKWLYKNSHRFGFILRYPASKARITGVLYEPWHFRYVGIEAATEIRREQLCLEEYRSEQ